MLSRPTRSHAAALGVVLLLVLLVPATAAADDAGAVATVRDDINELRTSEGLAPLAAYGDRSEVRRANADFAASGTPHGRWRNTSWPWYRDRGANRAGETQAHGTSLSPGSVADLWAGSGHHADIMLDPEYTHVAVATTRSGGQSYYTAHFVAMPGAAPPPPDDSDDDQPAVDDTSEDDRASDEEAPDEGDPAASDDAAPAQDPAPDAEESQPQAEPDDEPDPDGDDTRDPEQVHDHWAMVDLTEPSGPGSVTGAPEVEVAAKRLDRPRDVLASINGHGTHGPTLVHPQRWRTAVGPGDDVVRSPDAASPEAATRRARQGLFAELGIFGVAVLAVGGWLLWRGSRPTRQL